MNENNQKVNLSKDKEIELLSVLGKNHTYFADFFGSEVDIMIQNIQKDFAIELGTIFEKRIYELQKLKTIFTKLELILADFEAFKYQIEPLKSAKNEELHNFIAEIYDSKIDTYKEILDSFPLNIRG